MVEETSDFMAQSELGATVARVSDAMSLVQFSDGIRVDLDVLQLFVAAAAPNSVRAFCSDLQAFDLWCRRKGLFTFPATSTQISNWLKDRAAEGAAPASLSRYKASLAKAHRLLGLDDPTSHESCRLTISAHRRQVGSQQKQARPLRFRGAVRDPISDVPRGINLKALLAACPDDLQGKRNRALLSVAYDTGLRASEMVAIQSTDIVEGIDPDARLLHIRRHKGDQIGEGATAYLSSRSVLALEEWLKAAEIENGPVFRRVIVRRYAARPARRATRPSDLSGRANWDPRKFISKGAVASRVEFLVGETALHAQSLTPIFRSIIKAAIEDGAFDGVAIGDAENLVRGFSAHSTRVGLNQDLFAVGETLAGIMDALRWRSPKMALTYNRNLSAEVGAAGRLLSKLR